MYQPRYMWGLEPINQIYQTYRIVAWALMFDWTAGRNPNSRKQEIKKGKHKGQEKAKWLVQQLFLPLQCGIPSNLAACPFSKPHNPNSTKLVSKVLGPPSSAKDGANLTPQEWLSDRSLVLEIWHRDRSPRGGDVPPTSERRKSHTSY